MVLRIFRHFVPASIILLAISDIIIVFFAFYFFLPEKPLSSMSMSGVLQSTSLQLSMLVGAGMAITGVYHSKTYLNYRSLALRIGLLFLALIVIVQITQFYLDRSGNRYNSLWDIQKVAISCLVGILLTRAAFLTLVDYNTFKRRILVLGTGTKAARIAALAATGNNPHFMLAGRLGDPKLPAISGVDAAIHDGEPHPIIRCARELQVSEVVVATDDRRGLPVSDLLQCRLAGIKVTDYMDFIERETKTVDLAALHPGWLIFSDGFRFSKLAKLGKRCFDVLFSISLLLLTFPLMMLAAVLIMMDSPGPVFYRQARVGLGGRQFVLLKFRSMRADAEKDGVPRWALTGDTRVTRVGSIIRKLRIDELPQLWNVLCGDMSFVGPRPERPSFVDEFIAQLPFYAERHCVKPGITGWAQINYRYGASLNDARVKLSYDLYYVKNQGIFLDLIIALQTVRVILWADGAR